MQAKLVDSIPPGDWIYEIKFDGYRALALRAGNQTRILSRNQKDLGKKFPELVESVAALNVEDVILDGEIAALDAEGRSSFQALQARDMGEGRPPIVFYVFDLLRVNGQDLQNVAIEKRKVKLKELIGKRSDLLIYSESFECDLAELLAHARELRLEGLVAKRRGSKYEPGRRSGSWFKLKFHQEQDFIIGGYTAPEGTRRYLGAILVGLLEENKLKFAGRVGSGFSEKSLQTIQAKLETLRTIECPFADLPAAGRSSWDRGVTRAEMKRCVWVKPVTVCRIKFAEWTSDGRLRQPVFLGLRDDVDPKHVSRPEEP